MIDNKLLSHFMRELNSTMKGIMLPGRFLSFLIGILDLESNRLLLGNAGHLPPIHCDIKTGLVREIPLPSNIAVGYLDHFDFETQILQVSSGDKIVFYTDGLLERMNSQLEEFGRERLLACMKDHQHLSPEQLLSVITLETDQFSGSMPPQDDEAILVVEVLANKEKQLIPAENQESA
jgi:serine phosphatase RsbU (regulator of sigma subunit)